MWDLPERMRRPPQGSPFTSMRRMLFSVLCRMGSSEDSCRGECSTVSCGGSALHGGTPPKSLGSSAPYVLAETPVGLWRMREGVVIGGDRSLVPISWVCLDVASLGYAYPGSSSGEGSVCRRFPWGSPTWACSTRMSMVVSSSGFPGAAEHLRGLGALRCRGVPSVSYGALGGSPRPPVHLGALVLPPPWVEEMVGRYRSWVGEACGYSVCLGVLFSPSPAGMDRLPGGDL